ncbi:MAG: lipid II flippase MurJ [Armatimonadota bacterium]|nr:lipid II flippase MurJ [Armatimonadota bacterium]
MDEIPEDARRAETPPEESAGTQMTLAAIVISAFGLLGKVLGWGKEILIAKYWGAEAAVDAFVIVYKGFVFEAYAKTEKLLRPTYLPIFVAHKTEGDERRAWRLFSLITSLVFIVIGSLTVAAIIWAPQIIRVLFPALEMPGLAAEMLRIAAAAILLLVLSVMAELTLHSYKQFTVPAMADATRQLMIFGAIGGLVALGFYPSGEPGGIEAAAVGVLLGGVARLFVQLPALWRRVRQFRPSLDLSNPDVRRMFSLIPPVIVGLSFSALRNYFDKRFGTFAGEGVVAALNYGRMLADMPTLILPLAVSLVVYPYVSEWASQQDRQRLADSLVSMTRAMAFIFVPLAVAMIVLAKPIVATAFERGEFTPEHTVSATRALVPYSAGLPFFAVEASINKWYFALSDTATPNFIGASMAVLHILIAGAGVHLLNRNVGVIAAALSISKGLKVVILYLLLRGRIGRIDRASVVSFVARLLVATGAMIGVVIVAASASSSLLVAAGTLQRLIFLAACGISGVATYLIASTILHIEEVGMVVGYVREKLVKRFGSQ